MTDKDKQILLGTVRWYLKKISKLSSSEKEYLHNLGIQDTLKSAKDDKQYKRATNSLIRVYETLADLLEISSKKTVGETKYPGPKVINSKGNAGRGYSFHDVVAKYEN